MMKTQLDIDWAKDQVEGNKEDVEYFLQLRNATKLWYLANDAYNTASILNALDGDRSEVQKYFRWAAQAGAAHFQVLHQRTDTSRVILCDRVVEVTGRVNTYASPIPWSSALRKNIVTRSSAGLEALLAVPETSLQSKSLTWEATYEHQARALRAYFARSGQVMDHLLKAMETTAPEHLTYTDVDAMLYYQVPAIELWAALFHPDPAVLNRKLQKQTELYADYAYRTRRQDGGDEAWRFFNIEGLAVASIAYDHGKPITFEHPTLPRYLYEGGARLDPELEASLVRELGR